MCAHITKLKIHTDFPLASVRCLPSKLQNSRLSSKDTGGYFDTSTLVELPCGVTINDVENITTDKLPQLEVLTSQPELLSEDDIRKTTEILQNFQERSPEEEVAEWFACHETCFDIYSSWRLTF